VEMVPWSQERTTQSIRAQSGEGKGGVLRKT
jgi:hypothetical protein